MKKKNWAFIAITAVLLALTLIAFRPSPEQPATQKPSCCKKTKKCSESEQDSKTGPNDFRLESLSQQFIFIFPSTY
ncbi:MAG: hypothetical protein ABIR30_06680 [Chitinophagaceae bacterium]